MTSEVIKIQESITSVIQVILVNRTHCNCRKQGGIFVAYVGEWGWGVEGKQVGSMDEESQVRGCYITFICTPTNQETVSVLEKTQANKTFRT